VSKESLDVLKFIENIDQRNNVSEFNDFGKFQWELIKLTLKSSLNHGNVWDEIVKWLRDNFTFDHLRSDDIIRQQKLRFAAHMAMFLFLQDRISENSIDDYNHILEQFIDSLAQSPRQPQLIN